MSHFYASIPQSARKTEATACGHKSTGIKTRAASWQGAIETRLFELDGVDRFEVIMCQHKGAGDYVVIAEGVVGDADSVQAFPRRNSAA